MQATIVAVDCIYTWHITTGVHKRRAHLQAMAVQPLDSYWLAAAERAPVDAPKTPIANDVGRRPVLAGSLELSVGEVPAAERLHLRARCPVWLHWR